MVLILEKKCDESKKYNNVLLTIYPPGRDSNVWKQIPAHRKKK